MLKMPCIAAIALTGLAVAGPAQALPQYVGSMPVAGSTASEMMGGRRNTRPVGNATFGGQTRAGVWVVPSNNPGAYSWIEIFPTGVTATRANSAHITRVVGNSTGNNAMTQATSWRVTNALVGVRNLNPTGATQSSAEDIKRTNSGTSIVGWAEIGGVRRASLWGSKASTWVDLNPLGATASTAVALFDGTQVGWAEIGGARHGGLWTGSAASWIDLHPLAATQSSVLGIGQSRQVGWAEIGGQMHASVWNGTAASWEDLNPSGATRSVATAVGKFDRQAGWAEFAGQRRAVFWRGSSSSWEDLHALLPGSFAWSEVTSAWYRGHDKFFVGHGLNNDTGMVEALNWRIPTPGAAALFGVAGLVGTRRRR